MNMPTVPPLFEIWHDGGFLVSEANGHQSRDTITLTGGARVLAGTVLGVVSSTASSAPSAPTVVPGAKNTGNGTLALSGSPAAGTPPGTYLATLTSATAFSVTGPGLSETGLQTGSAVSVAGLTFTVTPGSTKFAAGDSFEIIVGAAGTPGGWCAWDPAATNGAQNATGILFATRDATLADVAAVAITRAAEVNTTELIWPPDATPAQIATATAQLQALGILVR
ncbi:head decoration protein [Burkholderia sp. BCC0405]|uniref:head decoration protein n=1 Tax=Burkholderia sp. BCC0405 TaxID=2676298 RepID=UPI001589938C|nr:head decoration protein [Burkholderia sp. BCC0405]